VPYRGTPETLNDVMVGRVNYVFTDLAASLALARDGRVKALGVTSKDTYPLVPDLSPLDRSGAPGFEMGTWFGLVAPAGTPTAIIELANVALERALLQERLATRLQAQGFTPQPMAAAAFRSLIDNEIVKWRQWATELKLEQTSPRRFMKLWKASHAALREGVWRTRVIGAG
jgi:tripartite-type tricarboxylate transporter receptor subunit TctC